MGYNIHIGNAVPHLIEDELAARYEVEGVENDAAPHWPNPPTLAGQFPVYDLSGKSNGRFPGYTSFAGWARVTGLYELFLGEEGLIRRHPGCQRLTEDHLTQVREARELWEKDHPEASPGWHDHQDAALAKLIWYEWWMTWALKNCRIPAISNS